MIQFNIFGARFMRFVYLFVLSFCTIFLSAQETRPIYLKAGTVQLDPPSNFSGLEPAATPYHLILGFHQIPDKEDFYRQTGIRLWDYLPENAFYATIPARYDLSELPPQISGFSIVRPEFKADLHTWASRKGQTVKLLCYKDVDLRQMSRQLAIDGYDVLRYYDHFNTVYLKRPAEWRPLLNYDEVFWAEPMYDSLSLDNFPEMTNHRVNVVTGFSHPGKGLTGKGVSMGEWDGGDVGSHEDYNSRLSYPKKSYVSSHATHVCGTMSSAGNIDPYGKGMAPSTRIFCWNFNNDITREMDTNYTKLGYTITQNSYAYSYAEDPCSTRGNYDIISRELDLTVEKYPSLLHVFAAGNSRSNNCRSGGFHTVHAGFQSAKNVLTVGAVTSQDGDAGFNSMGPTTDGRIKPEVTAVGVNVYSTLPGNTYGGGWSGTSMACPGTSGSAALIYEFYKSRYNVFPSAFLTRNVMANTADDLGNAGPDFRNGFGRINIARSVALLDSGRFFLDSVKHNRTDVMSVKIPKGLHMVKVMLTWNDPAGSVSSRPSLVNDLDLTLTDSNGVTWRPWVLDTINYNATAVRGRDSINNIEQITLTSPMAGNWKLSVRGKRVTTSFQSYAITMDFVYPGVTVRYPNGFESMPPPSSTSPQIIRWDDYGLTGNARIEYSLNKGLSWQTLSTTTPVTQGYFNWTGMDDSVNTSKALVRISLGAFQDQSDSVFSILKTPPQPVPVICDSQVLLKWPKQAGISLYNVYQLINGEMNVVYSGKDTFYTATRLNNNVTYWFALSTKSARGAVSMRTIAIPVVPVPTYIPPRITLNLKDTAVCHGKTLILSTTAKGTAPISSFWQKSADNGKTWNLIKANNDDTLILPNLKFNQSGFLYQRVYYNLCQNKVYSVAARAEVDTATPVFSLPKDTLGCFGGSITLRLQNLVSASTPWVYWQSACKAGKPSGFLKHSREPFLTLENLSLADAKNYPVSVRNGCGTTCAGIGCCGTRLSVASPLKMTLPLSDTLCLGETITLSPDVMDGNPALYRFSWKTRDTMANSNKLTLQGRKNGRVWLRMDDQGCSPDPVVDSMDLWIRDPVSVTRSPDTLLCFGTSTLLRVNASGGDGTYTCTWDNGLSPGLMVRVTPDVTTVYHFTLTDSCTSGAIHDSIRVTVHPRPVLTLNADQDTLCLGQTALVKVIASGGQGGKFSVRWQDGSGDTIKSFIPRSDTILTCSVSDGCSTPDPMDTLQIKVRAPLSVNISAPDSVCTGTVFKVTTMSSGGVPEKYVFTWNRAGAMSGIFSDSSKTSILYRVKLEDNCTSEPATDSLWVRVHPLPRVNAVRDTILCFGEGTILKRTVTGGKPGSLRTWWELNKAMFADSILKINPGQEVLWYYVANARDGCGFSDRDSVRVQVLAPLALSPMHVRKCEYADSVIRFNTTGGRGGTEITWSDGIKGANRTFKNTATAIYKAVLDDRCSDSVHVLVNVEVRPLGRPEFKVSYIRDLTVGLTGSKPLQNGKWTFGDGNSTPSTDTFTTHTYLDYGTYTLCRTLSDEIGCHSLHCESINVADARKNLNFSPVIIPNPFQKSFVIRFDKVPGQVELQLTDQTGRTILRESRILLFGLEIPVTTGDISAGIYYLKITANGEEHLNKLLVK